MLSRTFGLAIAVAASVTVAAAPVQAQTYFGPADMNIAFGPGGSISASFGQTGIVAGMFQHIYQFTLPQDGTASGSITTSAVTFQGVGDLDLLSVFFNGIQLTGITSSLNEVVFANAVPIVAGQLNEIVINGLSRGNGSYGGQGVFVPTAVPEPAAWGMLIAGFAFAGFAARRRPTVRVRFS
jgi:hypothetical protein